MNDDDLLELLRAHDSAAAPRFATGFTDRVMRRVHEPVTPSFDSVLARQAQRVLPALAAASLLLAAWNYVSFRDDAPSAIGAVLGVANRNALAISTTDARSVNGLVNVEAFE